MADPYVYEGTTILKNLADIRDQGKLDEFESTMVQLALVKLYKESIDVASARSIFEIHKALFSNVYEWAGEKRTINIYKHEQILAGLSVEYSKFEDIDKQLSSVDSEIQKYNWDYISEKKKIEKITRIVSSIWQIHPFREGNTRAVATFLFFFMKDKGLKLNTEILSNNA
ncbi:MAG: Fic family protein [Spirochaetales bacterium]|nr:Fic family protein [Spirochaetales bacterium]